MPYRIYIILQCLIICLVTTVNSQPIDEEKTFMAKREMMVKYQIEGRGISDVLVLRAMQKVPRHEFVSPDLQRDAYNDEALPIEEEQTISQPYIVAYMTEKLKLSRSDRVLEIGTGSGYQAAVLAEIVDSVYTIEIISSLAKTAASTLKKLKYTNIVGRIGDGYAGWPEKAPFDAIIVTAAPPRIPQPLLEQLAENGRMILPLGSRSQELVLMTKVGNEFKKKQLLPVRFVPMTGEVLK